MIKQPREATVMVAGVARNCGKTLEADVLRLESALKSFKRVQWFIVESDSSDDTLGTLASLSNSAREFDYCTLGKLKPSFPLRTERLAICRNRYLEELETEKYKSVDFLIVADLDGVNSKISATGIESSWKLSDWDACFPNQSSGYFDIWALRHHLWSPNDCWEALEFLNSISSHSEKNALASTYSRMIRIPQETPPIIVESAFGGLGIYQRAAVQGLRYSGRSEQTGRIICEHVPFHLAMGQKAKKLLINPAMINNDFTRDTSRMEVVGHLKSVALSVIASFRRHFGVFQSQSARRLRRSHPIN